MQGYVRRLVNPPVSSRAAFAEIDASKATDDIRTDESGVIVELSAAERIAEHTGHPEYAIADEIADALAASGRGLQLTSGERMLIASVLRNRAG